jgi:hypothetical protein
MAPLSHRERIETMNETEERLGRLRQREAKLVEELERTPLHQDRIDCLKRTREQIASVVNASAKPPYTVRLVERKPATDAGPANPIEALLGRIQGLQEELAQRSHAAFLNRRAELAARFYAYRDRGGR